MTTTQDAVDALLLSMGFDLEADNKLLAQEEQRRRQEDNERQRDMAAQRRNTSPVPIELPQFLPTRRTIMSRDEETRRGLKSAPQQ